MQSDVLQWSSESVVLLVVTNAWLAWRGIWGKRLMRRTPLAVSSAAPAIKTAALLRSNHNAVLHTAFGLHSSLT